LSDAVGGQVAGEGRVAGAGRIAEEGVVAVFVYGSGFAQAETLGTAAGTNAGLACDAEGAEALMSGPEARRRFWRATRRFILGARGQPR
jgi:hypothetical protein